MYCPFEAQHVDQPLSLGRRLVLRTTVCVCVCFIEYVLLIPRHRWDFILIDSYPDPFVKMTSSGRGTVGEHCDCTQRGIEVEVSRFRPSIPMFVCTSFSSFLWRAPDRSISASNRSIGVCICVRSCLCAQGAQRVDPLISSFLCEVWPLSARSTSPAVFLFRCHSLTHGSDTSWVLHRWENNTYLWPLELFLLRKPWRKNALAAHASFKCLPRDTAIETKGG